MTKLKMDDGVYINYRLDDFRDPWIAEEEKLRRRLVQLHRKEAYPS